MKRFALGFIALLGAYYAAGLLPPFASAVHRYLEANARIAAGLLRLIGRPAEVSGDAIRSGAYALSLRRGFDAIGPAWFFCAAVLAFPAGWRTKLLALPAGTAFLLILNLARIVSLFALGEACPAVLAPALQELWPAAFMVAVVALWLAWMRSALPAAHLSPDEDA